MGFEQDGLFHMAPMPPPEGASPKRAKWGGRAVMALRKRLGATLPAPCWRCGRMISEGDKWHVGHIQDRAMGGNDNAALTMDSEVAVECEKCNTSAGGRLGAAITNGKKVTTGPLGSYRERTIKWY